MDDTTQGAVDAPQTLEPNAQLPEGELEGGSEGQETQQEQIKHLNKLKLKVFGEEVEEELPFEIQEDPQVVEYLTKQLQLAKAAQRAMQENSSMQKQVQSFLSSFKSDTKAALAQLGIDPVEFAVQVMEQQIEQESLSPEEKQRRELEAKIKQLESERDNEKKAIEEREYNRLVEQQYQLIENQISEALETGGVPKTPTTVMRVAEAIKYCQERGVDVSAKDVLPAIKDQFHNEFQQYLKNLGEDQIEEFIGKELIDKVRKRNIAKSKAVTPATVKSSIKDVGKSGKEGPKEPAKRVNVKDLFGF